MEMKHVLIGVIIGLSLFLTIFVGALAYSIPDYDKAECIYYASRLWCKF